MAVQTQTKFNTIATWLVVSSAASLVMALAWWSIGAFFTLAACWMIGRIIGIDSIWWVWLPVPFLFSAVEVAAIRLGKSDEQNSSGLATKVYALAWVVRRLDEITTIVGLMLFTITRIFVYFNISEPQWWVYGIALAIILPLAYITTTWPEEIGLDALSQLNEVRKTFRAIKKGKP